jgi:hypothetical protein
MTFILKSRLASFPSSFSVVVVVIMTLQLCRTFSAPSIPRDVKKEHKKGRAGSASRQLSSAVNVTSSSSSSHIRPSSRIRHRRHHSRPSFPTSTPPSPSSSTTKDPLMLLTPDWKRKLAIVCTKNSKIHSQERDVDSNFRKSSHQFPCAPFHASFFSSPLMTNVSFSRMT